MAERTTAKGTTTRSRGTKKASSVSDWKSGSQGAPLDVPSGKTALVRPVGMQVFLQKGMVPNSLLPIVNKAVSEGKPMGIGDIEMTQESLQDIMDLFDSVVMYCVVEPKVSPIPRDEAGEIIPIEDREADLLYVDEVDFDDKQFIFQYVVGGTRDLEQFRVQQAALVASVSGGSDLPGAAKSVTGDR